MSKEIEPANRDDAETFLAEQKDIHNHPYVQDRTNANAYELADLLAEFTNWYMKGSSTPSFTLEQVRELAFDNNGSVYMRMEKIKKILKGGSEC